MFAQRFQFANLIFVFWKGWLCCWWWLHGNLIFQKITTFPNYRRIRVQKSCVESQQGHTTSLNLCTSLKQLLFGCSIHWAAMLTFPLKTRHGHGQISNKLHSKIQAGCSISSLKNGNLTTTCKALVDQAHAQVGGYYGIVFSLSQASSFIHLGFFFKHTTCMTTADKTTYFRNLRLQMCTLTIWNSTEHRLLPVWLRWGKFVLTFFLANFSQKVESISISNWSLPLIQKIPMPGPCHGWMDQSNWCETWSSCWPVFKLF